LTYGYDKGLRMSNSNLVIVRWFLSYAPLTLKNNQFQFVITSTVTLKFNIGMCHRNTKVKFEFSHISVILEKVIPLERWKLFSSFRTLTFVEKYVEAWNRMCRFLTRKVQFELFFVRWVLTKLSFLNLRNNRNFAVSAIAIVRIYVRGWQCISDIQKKSCFYLVMVRCFLTVIQKKKQFTIANDYLGYIYAICTKITLNSFKVWIHRYKYRT
jgi:hypothetical protein